MAQIAPSRVIADMPVFYVEPPEQETNVFAAWVAGYLATRTPWAMEWHRRRLDLFDPSKKAGALLEVEKIKAGIMAQQESTKRTRTQAESTIIGKALDLEKVGLQVQGDIQVAEIAERGRELGARQIRTQQAVDAVTSIGNQVASLRAVLDDPSATPAQRDQALAATASLVNQTIGQLPASVKQTGEFEGVQQTAFSLIEQGLAGHAEEGTVLQQLTQTTRAPLERERPARGVDPSAAFERGVGTAERIIGRPVGELLGGGGTVGESRGIRTRGVPLPGEGPLGPAPGALGPGPAIETIIPESFQERPVGALSGQQDLSRRIENIFDPSQNPLVRGSDIFTRPGVIRPDPRAQIFAEGFDRLSPEGQADFLEAASQPGLQTRGPFGRPGVVLQRQIRRQQAERFVGERQRQAEAGATAADIGAAERERQEVTPTPTGPVAEAQDRAARALQAGQQPLPADVALLKQARRGTAPEVPDRRRQALRFVRPVVSRGAVPEVAAPTRPGTDPAVARARVDLSIPRSLRTTLDDAGLAELEQLRQTSPTFAEQLRRRREEEEAAEAASVQR